jgi:citrate lyase beta subunit
MSDSRLRRALLFMPGDSREKIEKGIALQVDSIIMDLEDGVAPSRKAEARAVIAAALRELDFGRSERLVRTNAVDARAWWQDDLEVTFPAQPEGYMIPKVESAAQVEQFSARLDALEAAHGRALQSTKVLALIETGRGIIRLRELAELSETLPRLVALAFGAEDYAGDIGATRTAAGREVFVARSLVALYARAFDLQAIDSPFVRLGEDALDDLRSETRQSMEMGYTGKLAIHPRHLPPIYEVFSPTAEEIAAAQRLIHAHEEHQAHGTGAFAFDGRMVDMPIVRAAQLVIQRARAAGLLE